MVQGKENYSLGELFSELAQETRTLLRQEVQLAKTEVSEKVTKVQHGATSLAIGGVILCVAFEALVAAAIIGLAYIVEWWLAALIVGVVVGLIGLTLVQKGRENIKAKNLNLDRTSRTLQEDKQWAKEQMTH